MSDEKALLAGLCEQLRDSRIPLARAMLGANLLDPTHNSRGVRWRRTTGIEIEESEHEGSDEDEEEYRKTPWWRLVDTGASELRRRLNRGYELGEFPLLDELAGQGLTDYLAFCTRFAGNSALGGVGFLLSSWSSDHHEGFGDNDIAALREIAPAFALAWRLVTGADAARVMLTTYLGADAAARVLAGNIVRGRAEPIRAVIWSSDLVGFTRIADTAAPDELVALLNDYAACLVEVIEAEDGLVLKFMGDGILAIFPDDDRKLACDRALDAAIAAERAVAGLNDRRGAQDLPVTDFYLALHVGELLYGNIGSRRRLDFTVIGPAVNECARIGAMSRSLDQRVLISHAFAATLGQRHRLVSLGRYALRGVNQPQELFTLDRALAE